MLSGPQPPSFRIGPYLLDLGAGELHKGGARIRLQEKSLRVLAALAEQHGQVVTREELKKRLWPDDTFVDFETGLNTAVSKLRDALSDDAGKPRYIETIPRRGYRILIPVEIVIALSDGGAAAPTAEPLPAVAPAAERREAPGRRSAVRVRLWASVAAAVVALAGTGYWMTHGRPALSFRPRDSVLVADFENQTGDPRFDNALSTAFVVSMEQSRYANVFPRSRLDGVLTRMERPPGARITPALGREICQRENIRGLIVCSITRTGQEYALTAQLIDPQSGETVRSYTERSYGEDHVLEALELLSKEIREALGESLYQIHAANKPLPQVTTRSLSALQQYSDGTTLWNHGKYPAAITLFRAAIASDPDFAMAHAALGGAYYSYITNAPEDGEKEYEKALSLESRTTDRERMIIETRYASDRNHVSQADQLFRSYLSLYPDDPVMRFDYASLLRKNKRWPEAIEQLKEVLRVAPDFATAYTWMAGIYKTLGNYPDALQAYQKAFEIDPGMLTSGNRNREYGFTLVANGESQKAEQVFTAMLAKPETRENGLRSLAFLDLYRGRYASAQNRLEHSLETIRGRDDVPLTEARIHLVLAIVAEGQGDARAERQHLDIAVAKLNVIQAKVVFGAMSGDAYARAGFLDQAREIAAVITPIADSHNPEQMGYLHLLQGDLALASGQREKALELLNLSDQENGTGLSSEAVAHGYQVTGGLDKAIASYEKFLGAATTWMSWEPQQRGLAAYVTLASDYAARGERQKARETLATFLNLWKDADPNLPLLKQAKAEYAKLQ